MVKYKVTQAHDGKWYIFCKYIIQGGQDFRWVIESDGYKTRQQAVNLLPVGADVEDTIILNP